MRGCDDAGLVTGKLRGKCAGGRPNSNCCC